MLLHFQIFVNFTHTFLLLISNSIVVREYTLYGLNHFRLRLVLWSVLVNVPLCLERMCILLLFGGLFYKTQLVKVG